MFLSTVAVPERCHALSANACDKCFNVAASRSPDRTYPSRFVTLEQGEKRRLLSGHDCGRGCRTTLDLLLTAIAMPSLAQTGGVTCPVSGFLICSAIRADRRLDAYLNPGGRHFWN